MHVRLDEAACMSVLMHCEYTALLSAQYLFVFAYPCVARIFLSYINITRQQVDERYAILKANYLE